MSSKFRQRVFLFIFGGLLISKAFFPLSVEEKVLIRADLEKQIKGVSFYLNTRLLINNNEDRIKADYGIENVPVNEYSLSEAVRNNELSKLNNVSEQFYKIKNDSGFEGKVCGLLFELHKILHFVVGCNCELKLVENHFNVDSYIKTLIAKNAQLLATLKSWPLYSTFLFPGRAAMGKLKKLKTHLKSILASKNFKVGAYSLAGVTALGLGYDLIKWDPSFCKTVQDIGVITFNTMRFLSGYLLSFGEGVGKFSLNCMTSEEFRKATAMYVLGIAGVLYYLDYMENNGDAEPNFLPAKILDSISKLGDLSNGSWLKRTAVLSFIGLQLINDNVVYGLLKSNGKLGMHMNAEGKMLGIGDLGLRSVPFFIFLTHAYNSAAWKRLKKYLKSTDRKVDQATHIFWSFVEAIGVVGFSALVTNWVFTVSDEIQNVKIEA
ncbi:hypothetical protein KAW80_04650 [Candidatus Babeliales bacterium]|nr:hypothetical protein [Candidatus Babeliales bacterium]